MPVAPSRATSRWVEMMMTSTRSLLLASCVLVLAGCGVDDNGMILVVDHSYVPAVAVTTSDGITTPDGILWWHGKLIMADEGGCALRVWNHGHDVVTLCDRSLGILEPEDLVVDTEGNLTDRALIVTGRSKGLCPPEGNARPPSGHILVGHGVRHEVFSVTRDV